ncbi:hypothetical protein LMG27177_01155 [Paraburkholderia fynbosensis]|uniref:Uncharacterized protein n=1 Tax=Paraburkholderia fynbosensis TaxID=1200993 RepID=A0A6J5FN57_9BURK|nr:hypothetical protein LMG27177_01155 [Paraburkholderia fynbosensis]
MRKAGMHEGRKTCSAHLLPGPKAACMKMENLSADSRQREFQKEGVCFASNMKSTDWMENWMPVVCARILKVAA